MLNKLDIPRLLSLGPIGYQKASGSLASLVILPVVVGMRMLFLYLPLSSIFYTSAVLAATYMAFVKIAQFVKKTKAHDPKEIVLDEVIGVLWLFCAAPRSTVDIVLRYILFRFFDITKLGLQPFEKLKGAWGIMADDIVAALVSEGIVLIFFPWIL